MEVKSVSDCLNIIDQATIVENIIGSSDLEDIHKYLLEKGQSNFIEDRVALSKVLSQIKSMIENYYQFPEEDIKNEYVQLRKLLIVWLMECNTKPEIDDQQCFCYLINDCKSKRGLRKD